MKANKKLILELLSKVDNQTVSEIARLKSVGKTRSKTIIDFKVMVVKKLRNQYKFSLPEIGLLVGINHTSVLNLLNRAIK